MYEQSSNQILAASKQAAESFIKMNSIFVESFEKLVDIQLKTFEERMKSATEFFGQAGEVPDMEGAKTAWPKGMSLAKESAEKFLATSQEVTGVLVKTGEALGQLVKGQVDAANDSVVKSVKSAKAR